MEVLRKIRLNWTKTSQWNDQRNIPICTEFKITYNWINHSKKLLNFNGNSKPYIIYYETYSVHNIGNYNRYVYNSYIHST